jgi:hypothetical protein
MSTVDRTRVEATVRTAALALFILGVLEIAVSSLFFLSMLFGFVIEVIDRGLFRNDDQIAFFVFALAALPVVLCSVLITVGAYQMKRHRAYGFVTFAAILAMTPVFSPCFFVGIPVGIWVMFLLWQPEVEAIFRRPNLPPGETWDEDEDWRIKERVG